MAETDDGFMRGALFRSCRDLRSGPWGDDQTKVPGWSFNEKGGLVATNLTPQAEHASTNGAVSNPETALQTEEVVIFSPASKT